MNLPTHKQLAEHCKEAYKTFTIIHEEVEVLILVFKTYQVVVHRGTEDKDNGGWTDWLTNIRHLPPWYDKRTGWVHPGYLKTIRKAIIKIIVQLDPDLPTYVTGHSKGGGEAPICFKLLEDAGFTMGECVAFAPPRSILRWSRKKYPSGVFTNYRNGSDIVTLVPLRMIGYRHPGGITQIGDDFNREEISDFFHPISKYIENL